MTTLAQMFNEFRKNNLEWASGKIDTWPNLWIVVRNRPDVVDIMNDLNLSIWSSTESGNPRYFLNRGGYELIALVNTKSVRCPNLELWPDAFQSEGMAWVPARDCRKCTFYRKAKETQYKYPICQWAHDMRCGDRPAGQVAAQKTLDVYHQAVVDVNRIMP